MRIILLGAPGAGQGHGLPNCLTAHDGSVQISTGDILRGAVKAGTPLVGSKRPHGQRRLVPDSLIMGIMEQRLQEKDCQQGFLLDGFPRTIPQADALDILLKKLNIKLDLVANIRCPARRDPRPAHHAPDLLTPRARRSTTSRAIRRAGDKCKKCGSPTIQRADETIEAISKRLDVYNEKTAPLIGYYERKGIVLTIREASSDGVVNAIKQGIASKK